MSAVQAGDKEAFAELFRRHYPSVRRACARRMRDMAEADEIAQAAFVRAFERIDRCAGERRFGAWVQVIAQRLCVDAVRVRARTTPQEEPVRGDAAIGPNAPEENVLRLQRVHTVRAALDVLPPRQREVVIARDLEERRPGEIAATLGLSVGAVDSLLLRARRRLALAYRVAAGDQGMVTTASSAALAGGAAAAGPGGLLRMVAGFADTVRALVYQASAGAGMMPGVSSVGRRVVTAIAAGIAAAGGAAVHAPATAPPPPTGRPAAVAQALPSLPDLPALPTTTTTPPSADLVPSTSVPGVAVVDHRQPVAGADLVPVPDASVPAASVPSAAPPDVAASTSVSPATVPTTDALAAPDVSPPAPPGDATSPVPSAGPAGDVGGLLTHTATGALPTDPVTPPSS